MIRFNQPRYIVPLIILPFIYVLYYLFDLTEIEDIVQEVEIASINPTLPDPFLEEDNLQDKFEAFQEAYKNNRKSSAIREINRREEDEEHHKPSIPEEPLHPYPSKQIVKKTAYSQPNRTKELDSYEAQMKLFKAQMQYVDSLIQVEEEGSRETEGGSRKTGDGSRETEGGSRETGDGSREKEDGRQKLEVGGKKLEDRSQESEDRSQESEDRSQESEDRSQESEDRSQESEDRSQELEVGRQKLEGRSAEQQMVKTKSELSGPFNTIARQENSSFIRAVIDEDIKVTTSSRVRLRLLEDVKIGQQHLRKGQFLFGVVHAFKPQRVEIGITSILNNGEILDVSLEIYDLDGMKGLYIPGSRYRELTKEVGENITDSPQLPMETTGSQHMQLITALAKDAFNTTARTASKAIRKQKARLKYNTQVYLVKRNQ